MKTQGLVFTAVAVVLMLDGAIFQTVLQSDLEWKYFSGCCGGSNCQQPGLPNYYRYLSLSDDGKSVWVGAMNYLFKLNINDLTCEKFHELPVDRTKFTRCKVQRTKEVPDCQNHIRAIIELSPQELYVCGTGAFSPVNYTFDKEKLNLTDTKPAVAFCPYDPLDNNTAIKIDAGNPWNSSAMYFGTYTDFLKNFPVFYRPRHNEAGVQYYEKATDSEDNNYLYSPQFVGSFDEDDSVFFFFREIAVETPTDNRQVYSRVGKVCKKDQGGGTLEIAKTKWLSFQKTRLNCSLPGNVPFYFDDIYDVYKSGNYYYALFYKQAGFLSTSAICIYKKADILQAFRGKFQYKNDKDNWETLMNDPSPRLDNCSLYEGGTNYDSLRARYQLMDSVVRPVFGQPIFQQQSVQLMKIAVSEAQDNSRNIYVASDNGKVYDIFFKEGTSGSLSDSVVRLNKIYEPFHDSDEKSYAVWNMKLLDDAVIMGTDYNVTRLSLEVCASIEHIDTCMFDTRCVYNKCEKRCQTSDGNPKSNCFLSHRNIIHNKPIVDLLIELIAIEIAQNRQGISGIYTKLEVLIPVSMKTIRWTKSISRTKRSIPDSSEKEIDPNRDAFKYTLTSKGDLIIANTTLEDVGQYRAYNEDSSLIAEYNLTVIDSTDHLIEAWKQQFADWSTAFISWKHCSRDYFADCKSTP